MNLLIFSQDCLIAPSLLRVRGEKALHMLGVQKVQIGYRLRLGELGGRIGQGTVVAIDNELGKESLDVQIESLAIAPEVSPISLILALPRPQILKKVLQTVATMGVRELVLIRTKRVERSYFNSPVLNPEKLKYFLQLGLEQGISTILPKVSIYQQFSTFMRDWVSLMTSADSLRFVAHPATALGLCDLGLHKTLLHPGQIVVAIGPEAGFETWEIESLEQAGFTPFSLGPRVPRVDTAVCSILSQFELLIKLANLKVTD